KHGKPRSREGSPSLPGSKGGTVKEVILEMALQFEHTDRVLTESRVFKPSPELVENANITAYIKEKGFADWESLYQWSIKEPEAFWAEQASQLHWFKPW